MDKKKILAHMLLLVLLFGMLTPLSVTQAAPLNDVLNTLAASTVASQDSSKSGSGGLLDNLFSLVFDKILGPILNIFGGKSSGNATTTNPVKVTPLPSQTAGSGSIKDAGVLRGKVIVLDPGHGGSNPGAVANNTRESDNNLAVGLKLRDKLVQAGAKVIMTRDTDRTVAAEGSTLGQELQARVDLAKANQADIFVSLHSNENSDTGVAGAMTFYPEGKSSNLATPVQSALVKETGAVDKGVSTANYLVLRNASMPSILVEMGFVSNQQEAARLQNNAYRNQIAQGVFGGIVNYFNNK
ncbi:MAG TPA: N-acetylmuramoyl-L-alanine amidase [Negativicutes bacterium]|jgi:N-acetylmuramoyl-L-alanine amidase